uniref:alpha-L-rhamnosidase-related protein n=2 Tax=Cecembia sp. TaxID=1898110 RepID=UPI0025B9CA85
MKVFKCFGLLLLTVIMSCNGPEKEQPLSGLLNDLQKLQGKEAYLNSPFLTAGDRVYMVGHQDGTFPDLGWHVEGEMGGIWNHPIKLMDGFTAAIGLADQFYCLDKADAFFNYPIANKHIFNNVPGLEVQRFQFVPDGEEGLVVDFAIKNMHNSPKTIQFEFTGHTDLMPVWLGEQVNMIDYADNLEFDEKRKAWRGKDAGNNWFVLFGATQLPEKYAIDSSSHCNYQPKGKGKTGQLVYDMDIGPEEIKTLRFIVAGSYTTQKHAEDTYDRLLSETEHLLQDKKQRYNRISSKTKLSIEDKELEQAFEWVKYNTEWLVREVPEIGRGLGAGMPDYPWWFGVDNEYTLKGAIVTGRKKLVYETVELIHKLSEVNGNGRIVHEVSTNGVVFNPGNINETPQFASLIWWVFQWTGDKAFLSKYYPTVKRGLQWLMEENDGDGNLFPDGYGMMEIHGLESEMIDVAVYTQKAFADAAQMARIMGESAEEVRYQQIADELKTKINEEFWVEEFNSYADFIGTAAEALELIDAAIIRADTLNKPWAVKELRHTKSRLLKYPKNEKQGFVIFHNWVVNTPMEMGIADSDKAIRALDKGSKFVNPFGVFVTGIDRDESSDLEEGSFSGSKVFSYTGAVMTLPTGVQAIAENNYGRPDMALDYLNRMTRSFGFALPGSIYEVSPDYGMMTQAWNLYAYAVPIVTQFFGIQPNAHQNIIQVSPQFPSSWNEAKLEHVIIGDNIFDISYSLVENGMQFEITQTKNWTINFKIPKNNIKKVTLNGEELEPSLDKEFFLEIEGRINNIKFY